MSRSFHQSRFTARTLNEYKCKQRTLTVLTINTQSAIDINISVLNHALFNFRRLGIGHPADTATSSPGYPTVNKITPGSAAAKQLFECGDVLLEFNKIPVRPLSPLFTVPQSESIVLGCLAVNIFYNVVCTPNKLESKDVLAEPLSIIYYSDFNNLIFFPHPKKNSSKDLHVHA